MFIFAAALREGRWFQPRELDGSEEVLNRFGERSFEKIWKIGKRFLPLQPARRTEKSEKQEGVLKDIRVEKKSCKKIWRNQKKCLPLHHFPLKKRWMVER